VPAAGHHEFTFSLALSQEPRPDPMLAELATAVLHHVGYAQDDVSDLVATLERALAGAGANGCRRCEVAFQAHGGELQVALTLDDGVQWRTSRRLP
jgi:hypothetical protein